MSSKLLNILLLVIAFVVDVGILYTVASPGLRLALGVALLVPIVLLSSRLGLAEALSEVVKTPGRTRRFTTLRKNVRALLGEIKRLNWLVVDKDRGFGDQEAITLEIETCRRGMEDLFQQILATAGKPDRVMPERVDAAPGSEPNR